MVYVWLPGHGLVLPVIVPTAVGGPLCTLTVAELELLPQELDAVTATVYGPPAAVQLILILAVPWPEVMVPPPDTDQL
jgi:hypothetical protein